ncbi:MAG: peptidylprolyl isomerase A [Deltaproteobacteria bacterium]|nr:peptidylprolyl isomerase A [Deltaproteobacteria bacterium]
MKKAAFFLIWACILSFAATALPAGAADTKAPSAHPVVILSTNMGDIAIELRPDKAPISVKNFLDYVDAGFFNGTIFHRVIPNFMIQGGGFIKDMQKKAGGRPPIKNEADNGLANKRGSLAMARTQVKDSATSQFFINLADNTFLDHGVRDYGYAVFGKVIKGMDVVDKITAVKIGTRSGHQNVPFEDVIIKTAARRKANQDKK